MITSQEWERRINLTAAAVMHAFEGEFPKVAAVLGSGFRSFLSRIADVREISLSELPFFPAPAVKGHGASLVVGTISGRRTALLTGRVHLYEGYTPQEVVFYIRVLHRLGIESIVLTNAAGGVNPKYSAGAAVVIGDQINLTGQHCLTGDGGFFGPQFLDMTECYNRTWSNSVAKRFGLEAGVYVGLTGPTYETIAECRMVRILGGDMVGMSTVQEAIAAHQMGMKVGGLSFIANASAGAGENGGALTHEEVVAQGKRHGDRLADVLEYGIANL